MNLPLLGSVPDPVAVVAAASFSAAVAAGIAAVLLRGTARRVPGVRGGRQRTALAAAGAALVVTVLYLALVPDPHGRYALPAFVALAGLGVTLAFVDLDTHRLPDLATLPAYPVTVLLLALASWWSGDWGALVRAAAAGLGAVAVYGVLALAAPQGMGLGDVKLAGVLGLALGWLSWAAVTLGFVLAFVLAGAVSLVLIVAGRASMRTQIPFGPAMLAGALAAVFAGNWLTDVYLAL